MRESIYERLDAWKKAMHLATSIYAATQSFPRHELYGLTAQMRRAAVSVPSNIAEGRGRDTHRDFRQFVIRARASAFELRTQITIAESLNYVSREEAKQLIDRSDDVLLVINGLIRHLTRSIAGFSRSLRLPTPDARSTL
jgi:four helix bundle protein